MRVTCGVEHRRGEGCGLVFDDAIQDTNCPGHRLVDGSIAGDYCREHDFFGCTLHTPAIVATEGEYEELAGPRYQLPQGVVDAVIEHLKPMGRTLDGDYTAPARELTDTEIVNRIVSCMPTMNVDRAMGNHHKRNMLIQLTGEYDDIEWIRQQLLRRAAERPSTDLVVQGEREPLPPPDKRFPF